MNEISFSLKKYRLEFFKIDGTETHIINPNSMEALVNDHPLLAQMGIERKYLMPYIDVISSVREVNLFLGMMYNGKFKAHQWFPVLCLKWNNQYYHVHYRDSWMCRHCAHTIGRVLMPLSESDRIYYSEVETPPAAGIFQKIHCPKCGTPLQNHLILLGQYL